MGGGGNGGGERERERERKQRRARFENTTFFLFRAGIHLFFFSFLPFLQASPSFRLLRSPFSCSPREDAARALTHEQADSGGSGSSGSGGLRSMVRRCRHFLGRRRRQPAEKKRAFFLFLPCRRVQASLCKNRRRGPCRTTMPTPSPRRTEQKSACFLAREAGVCLSLLSSPSLIPIPTRATPLRITKRPLAGGGSSRPSLPN